MYEETNAYFEVVAVGSYEARFYFVLQVTKLGT